MNDPNTGIIAVFHGSGKKLLLEQNPLPYPGDGEVLVKIEACTLCSSDIHTQQGKRQEPTPTVLGHETVGRIVALPEKIVRDLNGLKLSIGQRILWAVFANPEEDEWVQAGIPQKSPSKLKYGHIKIDEENVFCGGLASHILLKKGTPVLPVPDQIPVGLLAPVSCSLATMMGAFRLGEWQEGKTVAIFGAGMLGIMGIAYAHAKGAREIWVIEPDPHRQEMAKRFGATKILNPEEKLTGERTMDLVIDTSGIIESMENGIPLLKIGGIAVWVGAVFPTRKVQLDPEYLIRNLLTLKGLHNYNRQDFQEAVAFISAHFGKYPFEKLVERSFSLEQVNEAFAYAQTHKPYRVAVIPGEGS